MSTLVHHGGICMPRFGIGLIIGMTLMLLVFIPSRASHAFELQWFGQAAFKLTTPGGKVILIDPFITQNPKTP
jgi:hypothetical protein